MKNYKQVFFILISFALPFQAKAFSQLYDTVFLDPEQKIIKIHNAINSAALRIRLDDDLHGIIESKNCSFCKTIKITITPSTKAYDNDVNVPLIKAKNRDGRYAKIIYDMETNRVSAIHW